MTIKEVESLTGMSRASIRYYEAEGLICPEREKNGYRIYTQEHVERLLRIRLLRALEIPIEEIREIAAERMALSECFARRLTQLEEEQGRFTRSVEVCRRLAADRVEFRELDAARCLAWLEDEVPAQVPPPAPTAALPKPGIWRRLLARSVDYALYILLWQLILASVFRMNLTEGITKDPTLLMQFLESIAVLACIMLFEPIFLRWWGTTPGKWIMGIRVTDDKGERLTYREAAGRCWTLLLYGYGLGIPVLVLIREIKSLQNVRRGEEPEWEWYSRLELRKKSYVRAAVLYVSCAVLLVALQAYVRIIPEIPPNRGELTVAEFAENFNVLQEYYDDGTNDYIISGDMRELSAGIPWKLDAAGGWVSRDDDRFYAWIYQGEPPTITLHTSETGAVSGVTLSFYTEWEAGSDSDTARRGRGGVQRDIFLMRLALQAFGGAQPENRNPLSGWRTVQDVSANGWRQDYAFVHKNLAVDYDVEFSGCAPAESGAPQLEEMLGAERCSVSYTFTVQLQDAYRGSILS